MAKPDDKPDMKKVEQRTKEAEALLKDLEKCKKSLASLAAEVKALSKKAR
jgi:uncharacterized protein YlxW (UPF0749 family)